MCESLDSYISFLCNGLLAYSFNPILPFGGIILVQT